MIIHHPVPNYGSFGCRWIPSEGDLKRELDLGEMEKFVPLKV